MNDTKETLVRHLVEDHGLAPIARAGREVYETIHRDEHKAGGLDHEHHALDKASAERTAEDYNTREARVMDDATHKKLADLLIRTRDWTYERSALNTAEESGPSPDSAEWEASDDEATEIVRELGATLLADRSIVALANQIEEGR